MAEQIFLNFEQDKQLFVQALQAAQMAASAAMRAQPAPTPIGPDGEPEQPGDNEGMGDGPGTPPPAKIGTQVPGMPLEMPQMASPMETVMAAGIMPPRLSDAMRHAGIDIPTVEWQDDPLIQLETLRRWALTDAFDKMPPIVIQLAREMQEDLSRKTAEQLAAAASQMPMETPGSEPAAKGTPSEPKQPGQPAGSTPPAKLPGG
jgi:hypothetical protein